MIHKKMVARGHEKMGVRGFLGRLASKRPSSKKPSNREAVDEQEATASDHKLECGSQDGVVAAVSAAASASDVSLMSSQRRTSCNAAPPAYSFKAKHDSSSMSSVRASRDSLRHSSCHRQQGKRSASERPGSFLLGQASVKTVGHVEGDVRLSNLHASACCKNDVRRSTRPHAISRKSSLEQATPVGLSRGSLDAVGHPPPPSPLPSPPPASVSTGAAHSEEVVGASGSGKEDAPVDAACAPSTACDAASAGSACDAGSRALVLRLVSHGSSDAWLQGGKSRWLRQARSSPRYRYATIELAPRQLVLGADNTLGFICDTGSGGGRPDNAYSADGGKQDSAATNMPLTSQDEGFVRLMRVGITQGVGMCIPNHQLRVWYHQSQQPSTKRRLESGQVSWHDSAPLPVCPPNSRRLIVAWSFNLGVHVGLLAVMLYSLISVSVLPYHLQASSLDEAEWHATFRSTFALSLINSFVLIDALKVVLLTLTSAPGLDGPLMRTRCRRLLVRKPLRRMHRVLDMVL
jgi:hypothetical protein